MKLKKMFFLMAMTMLGTTFPLDVVYAQGFQTLEDKYGSNTTPTTSNQNPPTQNTNNTPTTTTLPSNQSTSQDSSSQVVPPGMVYLGGKEWELEGLIKQMALWTKKGFLLDDKIKGKVQILSKDYIPIEMALQVVYSALESHGYTTYETPGGLIKIIKKKDSATRPKSLFRDQYPIKGDTQKLYSDNMITRIITLDNISANDIYSVVKTMVSKEGNSFAYPSTNSLIITDTGSNIDHILKLIKELDQSGPQEVLEIIPINYADAQDIAEKIKAIFDSDEDQGSVSRRPSRRRSSRRSSSPELQDVQAISQVISDERTNSVIIKGTKRAILKIRALIARLDTSLAGGEGTMHVYSLKYASADKMAELLNQLVDASSSNRSSSNSRTNSNRRTNNSRNNNNNNNRTNSGGNDSLELQGGVKIVPDVPTNQIVITASPKDFQILVDQVISKLDIPRPSVYLEATIMSMDVNKVKTLGFSGLFGGLLGTIAGDDLTGFGGVLPTAPSAIGAIAAASGGLGAGVISEGTISFTDGNNNTVQVPSVSAILQALNSNTDVNILSTPQLLTVDNEKAKIKVGQTVPVVTSGSLSDGGVQSFGVDREEVGVILTITPQISDNDTIRLNIEQEISNVFSTDDRLGPTLNENSVVTTVVSKDKQTIVIAGLIDDQTTKTVHKVPLLGDIPVIGNLFKNTTTTKSKSNFIIFITPYIVREDADNLAILKKKIAERNAFLEMNFGKKQRKEIRESIKNHATELLEFKCDLAELDNPCFSDASYQKIKNKTFSRKRKEKPVVKTVSQQTSSPVVKEETPKTTADPVTTTTKTDSKKEGSKESSSQKEEDDKSWDPKKRKVKYKS